jgi:hypothetical protein
MGQGGGIGFPELGTRRAVSAVSLAAAILAVLLFGCREEVVTDIDRNLAPDTYLTGVPAESTTTVYHLHLFWHGSDTDGKVVGYEYAVTDSLPVDEDSLGYVYTTRTDSIFIFQVGENQQVLGHRFYVRAIDNEGKVDPEPAWTFFGAVDLVPPTPLIIDSLSWAWDPLTGDTLHLRSTNDADPDTVPAGWNVRFAWTGIDGDRIIKIWGEEVVVGKVVQYAWQLVGRDIAMTVGGPRDTLAVYGDLEDKKYTFNLRAVDDAGFAGLDPATRVFVWNMDPLTFFESGVTATGDTLPHFRAISGAWEGEREFFDGDTVPLMRHEGRLQLVDISAVVLGSDPDPIGDEEITGFQYRRAGLWLAMDDSLIVIENLGTSNLFLRARATDGLGRRDGTPALLRIFVNCAPGLLDTLDFDDGEPILQRPMPGEEFRLETILNWGGELPVQVKAFDPDSTAERFAYQFRAGGAMYVPFPNPLRPQPGAIAYYNLTLPESWLQPGEYAIDIKVAELATGEQDPRSSEFSVQFSIVE